MRPLRTVRWSAEGATTVAWPLVTETTTDSTARRWRPRGVSLATRLAGALLALSLVSLAVATIVGVSAAFDLGRDIYEQRLEAAADAGA